MSDEAINAVKTLFGEELEEMKKNDEAEKKRLTEANNQLTEANNQLTEEKNQMAEKMKTQEEGMVLFLLRNNSLMEDIAGLVGGHLRKYLPLPLKKDSRWKSINISCMSVGNNLALFIIAKLYFWQAQ